MSTEPTENTCQQDQGETSVARRGMFAAAAGGLAAALAACGRQSRQDAVLTPAEAAPSRRPARQQPTDRPAGNQPTRQRAPSNRRTPAAPPRPAAPTDADLMIGTVAASLEQLAVNTYAAALDAAGSGALGEVPPAVAEFATTARAQHQAALDAWNGVLTGAEMPAVDAPPAGLEATVNDQFAMVTDVAGLAQLALMLEQVAAATYLDALGKLESPEAIELAGSIFPIDRQHISVLLFALGMYPVPETFANTDMAFAGGELAAPTMPATR